MRYLSILFIAALFMTSCANDEDEIFELSIEVDNVVFEAGSSQFAIQSIDFFDVQTRIADRLAASGRTMEDVEKILPKSAQLFNTTSDVTLDFIRFLTLEAFEGSPLEPNLKSNEIEIFFTPEVPQTRSTQIDIFPSLPDVKEHLLQEKFNFTINTELRAPPPSTVEGRLRLRFSVQ